MRVCDACRTEPAAFGGLLIKIHNREYTLDFCVKCWDYADANSLLIGINEVRKHEVKK